MHQLISIRMRMLLCGLFGLCVQTAAYARPYLPTNDQQIIATLPKAVLAYVVAPAPTTTSVSAKSQPYNFATVQPRIVALLDYAYTQGDPRAVGQAAALLKPFVSNPATQTLEVKLVWANVLQASHQFGTARSVLQTVVKDYPNQPDAWLMLAAIDLVQGRFSSAASSCSQLQDLSLLALRLACSAQVASMTGALQASHATLLKLHKVQSGLTPAQQSWIKLIVADTALRLGDVQTSRLLLAAPIVSDSLNAPVLVAHADWLLTRKAWQATYDVLTNPLYADQVIENDSLLLKLVTAELAIGHPNAQAHYRLLGQRIAQWHARGDNTHQREEAQYALLLRPANEALALARLNWRKQRETADIAVYAHAAIKAASIADMRIVQQWIQQTGFEYPQLSRSLALALNTAAQASPKQPQPLQRDPKNG